MSSAAVVGATGPRQSAAASPRARPHSFVSIETATPPSLSERIASFTSEALRPVAAALARGDGPHPKDVLGAAGEAGLAGILTDTALGGAGGTHRDFVELIEAVAREEASAAVILDVHLSVGTEPIILFGNAEQ